MAEQQPVEHKLNWEGVDVPISTLFDDPFYSRNDGREEAAYVFVDGNGLPARWAAAEAFAIAELGFGTGLNFIETWRHWRAARRPGQFLTYTSFEAYPLAARDISRALAVWPQLGDLTARLVSLWPDFQTARQPRRAEGLPPGVSLPMDEQTELRLVIGPAGNTLPAWPGSAAAWYLDGFSPAKNPEMWQAELMNEIAAKTRPGGTFATYTAAGWVRRNLEAAGFTVEKRPGHGGKREMMLGYLGAEPGSG